MGPENNGALTIPANICGNPAISIPVAPVDGLPVGMQVIGKHHEDALLLDRPSSSSAPAPGLWWPPAPRSERRHRAEPRLTRGFAILSPM